MLAKAGHTVRAVDRFVRAPEQESWALGMLGEDIEICKGDIADPNSCFFAIQDFEAVINLAEYRGTDAAEMMNTQCVGTANLFQAMKNYGGIKRCIIGSSIEVYGEGRYVNKNDERWTLEFPNENDYTSLRHVDKLFCVADWTEESDPQNPISLYGSSKLMQESASMTLARETGIPTTILRFGCVYGPGDMVGNSSALTQLNNAFLMNKNQPFAVNAMEDQVFDFIHVTDAANAVLQLINLKFFPDPDKRTINIGSGEKSTLKQAAEFFEEIYERHLDVEYSEKRPLGIPLSLVAYCRRADAELGWKPSVKFEKGIKLLARLAFNPNTVK